MGRNLLLTLLLLGIGLGGTAPAARNQGIAEVPWWVYVPVAVAAVAVLFRLRFPVPALATGVAASGAHMLLGSFYGPVLVSFAVLMYTVAVHRPLRVSAMAAGAAAVVLLVCGTIGTGFGMDAVGPVVAWVAAPVAIGFTVRVNREQAVRSRHDEARRQADAERLRVAQEVHDVVGHGLAAIHMQAEIALHLLAKGGGDSVPALTAISRTSQESLDELRATLGAVRQGSPDDRSPAPGLARLDALVDRTRSAGVPVSVDVTGPVTGLGAAVDLAAYRVVQESLTNVLRHAGTATAAVSVHVGDEVRIEVSDTGAGSPVPAGGGHGLAGMRERVTALGGTLAAGPRPGGGFTVTATLPVRR